MSEIIGKFTCSVCGYTGSLKPGGCPKCAVHRNMNEIINNMSKRKPIDIFAKRLDEIFEMGMPTKALIYDAFHKATETPIAPEPPEKEVLTYIVETIKSGAEAMYDEIIDKHLNWDNPKINKVELINYAKSGKISGVLRGVLRNMLHELAITPELPCHVSKEKMVKMAKKFYYKNRVPSSFEMLVVTLNAKELFGIMADFAIEQRGGSE